MAKPRTVTVSIELQLQCDPNVAYDIVDAVLDNGTLQDAIVEYASDTDKGPVTIKRAFCCYGGIVKSNPKRKTA